MQQQLRDLAVGISSGSLTTAILYPLDTIKIRLQASGRGVSVAKLKIFQGTTAEIIKNEGFRTLYRGIIPAMFGSGMAWGFYFLFYNHAKRSFNSEKLNSFQLIYSSLQAGLLTIMITHPIFFLKTRLQLEGVNSTGFVETVRNIVKTEGYSALYRGIIPSIWLTSHGMIQFLCYEKIKYYFQRDDKILNSYQHFAFGAASKIIAMISTYPMQLIKTRLQDKKNLDPKFSYSGMFDGMKKILKYEGIKGFYRGVIPSTLRVTPASAITLTLYEKFMSVARKFDIQ
eukprot:gene12191-5778_t